MIISVLQSSFFNNMTKEKPVIRTHDRDFYKDQVLELIEHKWNLWSVAGVEVGDVVVYETNDRFDAIISFLTSFVVGIGFSPIPSDLESEEVNHRLKIINAKFYVKKNQINLVSENNSTSCFCGYIAFTSGTTNGPKAVFHSWSKLLQNAIEFNEIACLTSDTNFLHIMPVHYMAGLLNSVLSPLAAGGSIFIDDAFSPAMALKLFKVVLEKDINCIWLSPTMLSVLCRTSRLNDSVRSLISKTVTHVFVGTSPLQDKTKSEFETKFGLTCQQSYGMTEILLTSIQNKERSKTTNNVGVTLPSIKIKFNSNGELLIKTPYIAEKIVEVDKAIILEDGDYFFTGDLGFYDGELSIVGRSKDLIIKGGININPLVIEEFLEGINGITAASVIGVAHDIWGEVPIAYIETSLHDMNPSHVLEICRKHLNKDYVPYKINIINNMPRTITGKVQKRLLKKHG